MKEVQINNVKVKIFEDGEVIQNAGQNGRQHNLLIRHADIVSH